MNKIQLKLNAPLRGHMVGVIVAVDVDSEGTIIDRYWRDRFNDAKIDNCVELVKPEIKTSKKKENA